MYHILCVYMCVFLCVCMYLDIYLHTMYTVVVHKVSKYVRAHVWQSLTCKVLPVVVFEPLQHILVQQANATSAYIHVHVHVKANKVVCVCVHKQLNRGGKGTLAIHVLLSLYVLCGDVNFIQKF